MNACLKMEEVRDALEGLERDSRMLDSVDLKSLPPDTLYPFAKCALLAQRHAETTVRLICSLAQIDREQVIVRLQLENLRELTLEYDKSFQLLQARFPQLDMTPTLVYKKHLENRQKAMHKKCKEFLAL